MVCFKQSIVVRVFFLCVAVNLYAADEPDKFEAIAVAGIQKHQSKIEINEPEKLLQIELESKVGDASLPVIKHKKMDSREEFDAELSRLKQQYKPFLADNTPSFTATRSRLELKEFQFRMEESLDRTDIARVFNGDGQWQQLTIPHYTGPLGWWRAYYRKEFVIPQDVLDKDVQILHFGAVSYECDVYLNGRMVGSHTGWFSPFDIDVTEFINRGGKNILMVEIRNEPAAQHGQGGRKIFAATSPGWDDPYRGWHCDQSGGGIWQEVYIEGCPKIHISDIFVRPNIDQNYIDVTVEVYQPAAYMLENKQARVGENIEMSVSIYPKNFKGRAIENVIMPTEYPADSCHTEYMGRIKMDDYKLWELESPYLYSICVQVLPKGKSGKKDLLVSHFGMRKFVIDTDGEPKGTLYLNNQEVILRGANHMGHLQREAMEGDHEQIIEDILIAKMANMNYWRLTQSPCQPIVYEYCDRLGIMTQTDLPLFELLSRSVFTEAIKQAGEMEKLVRNHPCNVMISYINETNQRHQDNRCYLNRDELEDFFKAATLVVHTYNPDRAVKPIDGDFAPPPPGLPDIHAYSLWYGSGWLPWGKWHRGYNIPGKPGWKWGMGEYGIEGLEAAETMFQYYPKDWLPENTTQPWNPDKIALAQTWRTHLQWYESQNNMQDWIEASQRHQGWAVRMMTRDLRRFKDNTSSAVHLLIDAWPAGWMKTLVDVNRIPKKSYFEYRSALKPLIVDIRMDRTRYFAGERLDVEFWLCNDKKAGLEKGTLIWEVWDGGKRIFAQSKTDVPIPSYDPQFCGYFNYTAPDAKERLSLKIKLAIASPAGDILDATEENVEVFPRIDYGKVNHSIQAMIADGDKQGNAYKLASALGLDIKPFKKPYNEADIIFIENLQNIEGVKTDIVEYVRQGGKVITLEQKENTNFKIDEGNIVFEEFPHKVGREFVSRNTGHKIINDFKPHDFGFWYNPQGDYIDYINTVYAIYNLDLQQPEFSEYATDAIMFNFGTEDAHVEKFNLSCGDVFDDDKGYGWDKNLSNSLRRRNKSDNLTLDTGITIAPGGAATFSVRLENGRYCVTPILGDAVYPNHFDIYAEGKFLDGQDLDAAAWFFKSYDVEVKDGKLDMTVGSVEYGGNVGNVINGLIIEKWNDRTSQRVDTRQALSQSPPFSNVLETGYGSTRYAAVGELKIGEGSFFFCQLKTYFDVAVNPVYGEFWQKVIDY